MAKHPKVFISYKWQDDKHNSWVERLYHDLRMKFGIDAQLDKYEVDFGDSFSNYMVSRIDRDCETLLFIITPESVDAVDMKQQGGVAFEMQLANARRLREQSFKIIGIYREGGKNTGYLRDHRYIDFRDDTKYNYNLDILAKSLLGKVKKPSLNLNNDASKTLSKKLTAHETLRNEECALTNKVAKLGVKWAEELNTPNIITELKRPIPEWRGYWWENIWSSITLYSSEIQISFVDHIFRLFTNSDSIRTLLRRMISFNRQTVATDTTEVERLAKDYMWRLLDWGGNLRTIRWMSENELHRMKLDRRSSHMALEATHKVAKTAGREAEWFLIRDCFRGLSHILYQSHSNDFADRGSWLVVRELMTKQDPFELEIELFFKGVARMGYGLDPPHKDYFYIGFGESNT